MIDADLLTALATDGAALVSPPLSARKLTRQATAEDSTLAQVRELRARETGDLCACRPQELA